MKLNFYKYQGAGNDFIIIDNRNISFQPEEKIIQSLCNRHFGIGADGLMLLEEDKTYDFSMRYFNSDGKEGTMCGNGGRCITAYARKSGLIRNNAQFRAIDGIHKARLTHKRIDLKMNNVNEINKISSNYFINTGSPHYIIFKNDIDKIDVYKNGKEIRYRKPFRPDGTNVNYVEVQNNYIYVRTYERGVENETLSCGTGVTASAIATHLQHYPDKNSFHVKTRGGNMVVSFEKGGTSNFFNVWLSGPAEFVFNGIIEI